MAEITINSVVESLKAPMAIGFGAATGMHLQKKYISKLFNNETMKGLLGADNSDNVSKFATPIITALGGVLIAANVEEKTLKNIAIGIAASGGVKMADNLIFKNQLLQGILGNTDTDVEQAVLEAKQELKSLGYSEEDDELEGIDDDDELEGVDDDDDELEGVDDDDDELEGIDLS